MKNRARVARFFFPFLLAVDAQAGFFFLPLREKATRRAKTPSSRAKERSNRIIGLKFRVSPRRAVNGEAVLHFL